MTDIRSMIEASYGMLCGMSRAGNAGRRHRLPLRLVSLAAIGSISLSGCVQGGSPDDKTSSSPSSSSSGRQGTPGTERVLQSRSFSYDQTTLRIDVLALSRLNNNVLKLRLKFSNPGDGQATFSTSIGKNDFANVALVDGQAMKAYFPLVSKQGTEIQAGYPESSTISAGQSITASIYYPSPPTSVTKLDIASPINPPFIDIPIQGTAQVLQGEPDPTRVPLKTADIENITSMADDLSGDKSVDQSGSGESVRLNADVLFALNKASLSKKAHGLLKDVAKRIDKASSSSIKVDGYTDNTGNDSINDPLSRRRAEAVAKALKKLVTRSGVTFQTAGHGSSDPVASNDSSAGRQKNRRVTVTIGK